MKNSTKNQIQGSAHENKGKLKEAAGVLSGDKALQRKGRAEKIAGKVQSKIGAAQQLLND